MKVLYDGFIFSNQAAGGINRYFAHLIGHLPDEFQPVLLATQVRDVNWPHHPRLKVHRSIQFRPIRVSRYIAHPFFRAASAWEKPDVVHPTYYQSLTLRPPNGYGCPSVITVYDFVLDIFAEQLDPQRKMVALQRTAIEAADTIICISNSTRNDLLERFPHMESKTTVTHLAGELDVSMSHGEQPVPERPYFLFVGSRTSYKNFDGLLRAFAKIAEGRDIALAVVGSPFNNEERKLLEALKVPSLVENLGHVEDPHLAKLYRCSIAFVYPSFYEGFGIPPLEAMNCETVVIATNNSSIPEVTGDAALIFDAKDDDALAELMLGVLQQNVDRQLLIHRGKERAKTFSWERTSAQTAQIYRDLATR
jgi:glycosyltransferase involved in cell wall biosynthesis